MKFGKIALGNIISVTLSSITAVSAAIFGLGYWSIVLMTISQITYLTIYLWIACSWRPSSPIKPKGIKEFLHFGSGIAGFNIINYFSRNMDNILVGKYLGPTALGFYSKAYQLLMLPLTQLRDPLTTVGIPALSTLSNTPEKFKAYYKKYLFLMAFFSMPLVTYLAVYSDNVITIVLGQNWLESSLIFKLLAISAFIQPVASTRGLILISTGNSKRFFIWGAINAIFVIIGFLIGIKWGILGITLSYAIVNYGLLLPSLIYCFQNTPITPKLFFREITTPTIHVIIMCLIILPVKYVFFKHFSDLLITGVSTVLAITAYYFSWYLYPLGRDKIKDVNDLLRPPIRKVLSYSRRIKPNI